VRLEALGQLKNSVTSSGIEHALRRPVTGIAAVSYKMFLHSHTENLRNASTPVATFSESLTNVLTCKGFGRIRSHFK
jgi:hypothetical protein